MPTHHERLFHGIGAGDDLGAVETPLGRVGGLIAGRTACPGTLERLPRRGPDLGRADGGRLGRLAGLDAAYRDRVRRLVVSAPQFIPRSAFPADFPAELPDKEVSGNGGACIVDPEWGEVIAGPLYGKEGIVTADCDLRRGLHAKRWFDAVGHYSRARCSRPGPTRRRSRPRSLRSRTRADAGGAPGPPIGCPRGGLAVRRRAAADRPRGDHDQPRPLADRGRLPAGGRLPARGRDRDAQPGADLAGARVRRSPSSTRSSRRWRSGWSCSAPRPAGRWRTCSPTSPAATRRSRSR